MKNENLFAFLPLNSNFQTSLNVNTNSLFFNNLIKNIYSKEEKIENSVYKIMKCDNSLFNEMNHSVKSNPLANKKDENDVKNIEDTKLILKKDEDRKNLDNQKKYYHCDFPGCNKKFTANYNKKIHNRTHTGERPFNCEICSRNYYDRANYRYHIRTAHAKISKTERCCGHPKCKQNFKSKKQKLMHHEKLEPECHYEKNLLLNLIKEYYDSLNKILRDQNLKNNVILNLKEYHSILDDIKNADKFLTTSDIFYSLINYVKEETEN